MNFFEAQERSYRNTHRLILVMSLAVIAVAASVTAVIATTLWLAASPAGSAGLGEWLYTNLQLIAWLATGTVAFIGFASLYRIASLRQGGAKVARDLGGTLVNPGDNDPLRRRLHNVVEEMAIASGVPTPKVYILDHESGINAFAAGFSSDDAAIAVTRGALETLNREELQGVIAHEFSHIFNGDMRLNIQLMGPMFGILAIGLLGRLLLRTRSSGRGKGSGVAAVLALGAGLTVTGYVGLLLARLIKAGVSRQREYLADASAVQFTRQTRGIAGALKKIGGYQDAATIRANAGEEVSHMLFASGFNSVAALLATHPPLIKRIQALEPSFTRGQFRKLHTETTRINPDAIQDESYAGLSAASATQPQYTKTDAMAVVASVGNPTDDHYRAAQEFRAHIPATIRDALESSYQVMLLLPALILHPDPATRDKQLALLDQQLGTKRREHVQRLYNALQSMHSETRLPLLNLALPQVKEQPTGRLDYLGKLLEQLAAQDNQLELFEYALLRVYQYYIRHAAHPAARRKWLTLNEPAMQAAAAELVTVYAEKATGNRATTTGALERGLAVLGTWPVTEQSGHWVERSDHALDLLQSCTPHGRQTVIQALLETALADGYINQRESELVRAFCSILECPLPPVMAAV